MFGLPLLLLSFVDRFSIIGPGPRMLGRILGYGIIVVAIAVATVGARRYRLSRTSWRGIRFSFRGRIFDYVKMFTGGMFLSLVTLGLYTPFFDTRRQAFLTSNTFFGNEKFAFDGKGRALFGPFLVAVLLTIPTVGLSWFWYVAKKASLLLGSHPLRKSLFPRHGDGRAAHEAVSRQLASHPHHP